MEEEKSVSFMDICHVIKKNLILVLVVTAIITIVGSLLIALVYNRAKTEYSMDFSSSFLNSSTGQYPNGVSYNIKDSISLDVLAEIKESSSKFSSIDVQAMVEADDISLTTTSSNNEDDNYTITVKAKYFSDDNQASEFINAIINYSINKANNIVASLNYSVNLIAYDSCQTTYADKLSYLSAQKTYIYSIYDKLIEKVGENYVISNEELGEYDGWTLKQLKLTLDSVMTNEELTYCNNQLEYNRYKINGELYQANAKIQIALLEKEKGENELRIEALKDELQELIDDIYATSSYDSQQDNAFLSQIESLTLQNQNIDIEIADITDTITKIKSVSADNKEYQLFLAQLASFRETLDKATQVARIANMEVYEEESRVDAPYKVAEDGGLNIYLGIIISLIVGFIIIAIIVCIKDLPKYLKEKNAPIANNQEEQVKSSEDTSSNEQ